jgi:hypothetical protein
MGLLFTIAAGLCHCSHSQVRGPWDSWAYFTVSDSRLPQTGRPGPCIYVPQEQGGPIIPRGTGFPFHLLLWLAGLWWKYLTQPPHGTLSLSLPPLLSRPGFLVGLTQHKKYVYCLAMDVLYCYVFLGTCFSSHCLAMSMARAHIENTSCNTFSLVACMYCGCSLAMGLIYCWLRICCGLVYQVIA